GNVVRLGLPAARRGAVLGRDLRTGLGAALLITVLGVPVMLITLALARRGARAERRRARAVLAVGLPDRGAGSARGRIWSWPRLRQEAHDPPMWRGGGYPPPPPPARGPGGSGGGAARGGRPLGTHGAAVAVGGGGAGGLPDTGR